MFSPRHTFDTRPDHFCLCGLPMCRRLRTLLPSDDCGNCLWITVVCEPSGEVVEPFWSSQNNTYNHHLLHHHRNNIK